MRNKDRYVVIPCGPLSRRCAVIRDTRTPVQSPAIIGPVPDGALLRDARGKPRVFSGVEAAQQIADGMNRR